jgi:hypothetical protein
MVYSHIPNMHTLIIATPPPYKPDERRFMFDHVLLSRALLYYVM